MAERQDFTFGLDPASLARQAAQAMWETDTASQGLGIELLEVGPGFSRLALTVRQDMVNGHGILHGGFAFALCDSAFAFACNAYNEVAVAAGCEITFTAPGRLGDRLTAECREQFRKGRSGVYDTSLTNQDGTLIALFRGKSRSLGSPLWTPAANETVR